MDPSECISNTIWESYAAKTLNKSDKLKLQKHAATCEICADIKAGIDALAKPENLYEYVQSINTKVDTYLEPKKRKYNLWIYTGIAAVFIALLSITWFFVNNISNDKTAQAIHNTPQIQSSEIAVNDSVKTNTKIIESIIEPNANKQLLALNKKAKAVEPKAVLTESVQKEAAALNADQSISSVSGLSAPKMELKDTAFIIAMADKTEEEDVKVAVQESINVQEQKVSTKRAIRKATKETLPSNYMGNNVNNNLSNTNGPDNYKNSGTSNSILNDSINYSRSMQFFESKQYDSCNYYVSPIINNPASIYQENALLLKAKSLLNQNKNAEAKAILKQVISLKKAKAPEAKVLLKGIE